MDEGDIFQGWRVERIDDHSVVLERDGRTERLVLTCKGPPRRRNRAEVWLGALSEEGHRLSPAPQPRFTAERP